MNAIATGTPLSTTRSWRISRAALAEIGLVAALTVVTIVVLYQQALRQPFSVDESRWISTSRYFWITFVEGDVLGPAWQPNYLVLTHPPVARYVIGLGLALQGWSPDELNGRYDTDRSRDFNRRAGNIPGRELLDAARRVVLVFGVSATLLLYPIGRSLGGPLAGTIAVALALAHPLLATLWTRALAESVLAFFCLLSIWLAMCLAAFAGSHRAAFSRALGLGVAVGLATATKLSGALVAAGLVLYAVVGQVHRLWRERSLAGVGSWFDAGLAAVVVFVAVNPLLYPNPAWRSVMLFEHRRIEMEQQAIGTPRLAVPTDLGDRSALIFRRTFQDWGTFDRRLGLPLDAPLTAIGFGVVLVATWRSVRLRDALGPAALVLCWASSVFVVSTLNFGFDSSHYIAPLATVAVVLQAVALATLVTGVYKLVRRRMAPATAPSSSRVASGQPDLSDGSTA